MTVTRLRAEMPLSEWMEWIAYKKVQAKLAEEARKNAKRESGGSRRPSRRGRRRR